MTARILVLVRRRSGGRGPPPIAAFSFETALGRPEECGAARLFNLDSSGCAGAHFTGIEKIQLQVRSSTDTIVFNSLNEALHDAGLTASR